MLTANTPSTEKHHATTHAFSENFSDISATTLSPDQQIFLDNHLAAAGMKIANSMTPDEQNMALTDEEEKKKKYHQLSKSFALANTMNIQQRLSGLTLSDTSIHNGIMQIKGEDGEHRNATLEEKIILEDNSDACSIALTQNEIDMNNYMNGKTDVLPEALKNLAEEQELNPNALSREDYNVMIAEKFPAHVANRILESNNIESGINIGSPNASPITANPASFNGLQLGDAFKLNATGLPQAPLSTPTSPLQQTSFTPTPGI